MLKVDGELIAQAIKLVRTETWGEKWRDLFLYDGEIETHPVFKLKTWNTFCVEWSVGRTIREKKRDDLRLHLAQSRDFEEALQDSSGKKLGQFATYLSTDYGARRNGSKPAVILSAISKVATFIKPKIFVAWDTYAAKGVNLTFERSATAKYKGGYSQYLADFNQIWKGEHGRCIRTTLIDDNITEEQDDRFGRRVLDLYLMNLAGREAKRRAKV